MKLVKKAVVLSLFALALTGCTQSSISTQAPVAMDPGAQNEQYGPGKSPADMEEEVVERVPLVEDEPVEEFLFDAEQVESESQELFGDAEFYPQGVSMTYELDEDAKTVALNWVLKNGTSEDEVMEYATELVQKFNDILAVQTVDYEMAEVDTFGGVWADFSLDLKVATEDGSVTIEKSYAAGDAIDLVLPDYSGEGPGPKFEGIEEDGPKKPGDEKK